MTGAPTRPAASGGMQLAAAMLLGAAFAAWLYGWRVIDPASSAWLLHGDPAQHYLGAVYFLGQDWHWPPGLIRGIGVGGADGSVMLADALPLLALPAKLLGWPAHWQYFGLWIVACHALAAACGLLLLRRLGCPPRAALPGALFFTLSPMLLLRAYGHEALQGQFLVLAALALALAPWRAWPWLVLAPLAAAVHPYLAAMVLGLLLAAALAALSEGATARRQALGTLVTVPLLAAGMAYLVGAFGLGGQLSAEGFGFYSANLLTWFDPMDWAGFLARFGRDQAQGREWSTVLPALGQATAGQYEGFAYLGLGMLVLLGLALLTAAWPIPGAKAQGAPLRRTLWVLAACLAAALLAFSHRPGLGSRLLFELPLAPPVATLLGLFRASGRFIWPLTYLLLALTIARVGRLPGGAAVLVAALALQVYDLSGKLAELRDRFHRGPPGIAAAPAAPVWAQALAVCPRAKLLFWPGEDGRWITPALAAARAGVPISPLPLARPRPQDQQAQQAALRALAAGRNWRDDTLYVALPGADPLPAPAGFVTLTADGYLLHLAPRCLPGAAIPRPRPWG
jgi:hypothetical protein